ncbi:MAG TPA: GNAT family N-acetyltransferase [Methyloceanibacter sp.]|nr:GNAT family N-acetyltransferase [Methyloceanibacter sp.]
MDARSYAASETLRDGTMVTVRAIRPNDAGTILKAFRSFDRESVYRRFFNPKKDLSPAELEQLTDVDFSQVVALVVTKASEKGEVLIGGGRYAVEDPDSGVAEIAFMTSGDYRGLGTASLILKHLWRIAQDAGVQWFEAEVLAENQPMLAVFRRSGLPMRLKRDGGIFHVTLQLEPESQR